MSLSPADKYPVTDLTPSGQPNQAPLSQKINLLILPPPQTPSQPANRPHFTSASPVMERAKTPPRQTRSTANATAQSPPTPEVTRRIEENRLKAKALRDQHEAARRAAGAPELDKTPSGFIATDNVHIPNSRKRGHADISQSAAPGTAAAASSSASSPNKVPATNRDGRNQPAEEGQPLRPARTFAKFVDYNMSAMTDTKGGFLSLDDDPHNSALKGVPKPGSGSGPGAGGPPDQGKPQGMTADEWQRLQTLRNLQRQKSGPYEPSLSVLRDRTEQAARRCRECDSPEIDFVWAETFNLHVCSPCKERHPHKYSLLTKTECKEDYLLTEPELKDPELLPHLSKPNPHKSHWHDMMLFLRCQVEEYAFGKKWGSEEALDEEFRKRQEVKKARKEKKFQERLTDLKRKTRTDAFRRQAAASKGGAAAGDGPRKFGDAVGGGKHVHEWGRTVENEEGMTVKSCVSCGMEVEELEF